MVANTAKSIASPAATIPITLVAMRPPASSRTPK